MATGNAPIVEGAVWMLVISVLLFWLPLFGSLMRIGVNEKTGRRELGRRMHDLRRTAARDRVDDGTPERVVMAMTGHRTRAMFDRYSIASTKDIELRR